MIQIRDNWGNDQNKTWVRLGMLPLIAQKHNFEVLYVLYAYRFRDFLLGNQDSYTIPCILFVECDPVQTHINHYKLRIFKKAQQIGQTEGTNREVLGEVLLGNTNFLVNFINFQDRQILRLSNPIPSKPHLFQRFNIPEQNEEFNRYFQVEVEILEQVLIKMTQTYEKQERKGHAYWYSEQNNRSKREKSQLFCEDQFINILSRLKKYDEPYQKIKLIFLEQNSNQVRRTENQIEEEKINGKIISTHTEIKSDTNVDRQVEKKVGTKVDTKVITIQNSQDATAGLYFDLHKNTIQTKEPPGFVERLKPYQAKGLTWMLFRQGQIKDIGTNMAHIPLWTDKGAELGLKQKLYICNRSNFVVWKRSVQKQCKGGILADEMGLGKTITTIALILAHRPSQRDKTLIIAPLNVISQWQGQIKKFAPSLRVLKNEKNITIRKIKQNDIVIVNYDKIRSQLKKQDQSQFETLLDYDWFRVVIDQAHNFNNSSTLKAEAAYRLNAQYRWCLSGTPAQNKIGDIYSLFKFLRFQPWDKEDWWQAQFPTKNCSRETKSLIEFKQLLKGVLLRRRVSSLDEEGKKLQLLPKAQVKAHMVSLSEQAKILYKLTQKNAMKEIVAFQKYQKLLKSIKRSRKRLDQNERERNLNRTMLKRKKMNYILRLISQLRMICCHQFLYDYISNFVKFQNFKDKYLQFLKENRIVRMVNKHNFFEQRLQNLQDQQNYNKQTANLEQVYDYWKDQLQSICQGKIGKCNKCGGLKRGVITPCLHVFCLICITEHITEQWQTQWQKTLKNDQTLQKLRKSQKRTKRKQNLQSFQSKCPKCNQKLKLKQVFDLPRQNKFNRSLKEFVPNQKISTLMNYLEQLHMRPQQKAIVYTSFLGMMDLVCQELNKRGVKYLTIKGQHSSSQRDSKIKSFNNEETNKVLLITLKTGAEDLNLQVANKVFFMDPWWNPNVQQQAITRVHRPGQTQQVEAIKFITAETIETRIVKISFLKKQTINCILDVDNIENTKYFQNRRQQIKYLLSMQDEFSLQVGQQEVEEMEDNGQEIQNRLKEDINREIMKILENGQREKDQNNSNRQSQMD